MGNFSSTNLSQQQQNQQQSNSRSFDNIMDYIATHYILTMDFQSLTKLHDKKYCENMVVLTSDIIQKYFNDMEITYLAQRVKNGVEVNEMAKDDVIFFNKEQLHKYDVGTPLSKKRICSGIAKFYIKIAHLFSAIIMTINPVYVYKDDSGNTVKKNVMEKGTIPLNAKDRRVVKRGICSSRLESLVKGQDYENIGQDGIIKIQPNVCNMKAPIMIPAPGPPPTQYNSQPRLNIPQEFADAQNDMKKLSGEYQLLPESVVLERENIEPVPQPQPQLQPLNGGASKSLSEEPGIPELFELYLDKYDYQTGTFTEMSEETKISYFEDLKNFYLSFTGESSMPPNIQKFSDIKLRDYQKTTGCQTRLFKKPVQGSLKDFLFQKYAINLQKMAQTANEKQESLLDIINSIFTYDLEDGVKRIRVHPKLNEDGLKILVEKTRKIIVDLYITCENDFVEGVKIYEAIIENQIRISTESQINQLDMVSKEIYGK